MCLVFPTLPRLELGSFTLINLGLLFLYIIPKIGFRSLGPSRKMLRVLGKFIEYDFRRITKFSYLGIENED